MIFSKEVNKDGVIYQMIQFVFGKSGVSPITCGFFFQGVWCMILGTLAITSAGGGATLLYQIATLSSIDYTLVLFSENLIGKVYSLAFTTGFAIGILLIAAVIVLFMYYLFVVLSTGCFKRDSIEEAISNQEYLPWVEFTIRMFNKIEEMRKKFKEKYCKPISFK